MTVFLDKFTEANGGIPIYFNDGDKGVSMAALDEGLDIMQDIMFVCLNKIDEFIEARIEHGVLQGDLIMLKLGLDHALAIAGELAPASLEGVAK